MYFYRCTTRSLKKKAVPVASTAVEAPATFDVKSESVVVSPVVEVKEEVKVTETSAQPLVVPDAVAVIGDTVDTVIGLATVDEVKVDVNRMSKSALFKLAEERGISVEPTATRNELVKILS